MDIHNHDQLMALLDSEFRGLEADITFTQWDGDSEDEEVTHFRGQLTSAELQDNEFGEKDLRLTFATDGEQELEVLMEIPAEEVDLGSMAEGRLHIFGTEAEIVLSR
jgi:hypothetical protein